MADLPHILIIMPDQLRADTLGCAGHPVVKTPNIDKLAEQGMRFTNAITPSPVCMPARASFISGQFPHQHHIWHNAGCLPAEEETFFQHLQQVGYRTAHIGKSHYYKHQGYLPDYEPYMHKRGFDYVHEITGPRATRTTDSYMTDRWKKLGLLKTFRDDYATRDDLTVRPSPMPVGEDQDSYVGREAVDYIHRLRGDQPTCTFVGFGGPHEPWDPPGEYAEMYDPADMPPPIEPSPDAVVAKGAGLKQALTARRDDLTPEKIADIRAAYYGKVSLIDHWVGRIIRAYEEQGWLSNTLVIFWSDHGEMAGDHGRIHKSCYFHGSVDVPFIVRLPGQVHKGSTSDALVQTTDIFPTIMGVIGRDTPDRVAGQSLWPVLHDPGQTIHDTAFSEIGHQGRRTIMARTDRYTFAVHQSGESVLLFDEKEDPDQWNNLVEDPAHADVVADMRERIFRFLLSEQETRQGMPRL